MKTAICSALFLCATGILSSSCSSSNDDTSPPPPPSFSGDSLVFDAVQHTSETSEPVAINGQDLTFSEDPHAFDSVFQ